MMARWSAFPAIACAGVGAVATAVCAAWAAFTLGVPGRSARWAWLPVPGLLVWVGFSGLGCARDWLGGSAHLGALNGASDCLVFILGLSLPLSVLLTWLVRRACPLRPVLTALLIGLASAAASATLLEICHPYAVAATDLLTHALAVAIVVGLNALMGGRLLQPALR